MKHLFNSLFGIGLAFALVIGLTPTTASADIFSRTAEFGGNGSAYSEGTPGGGNHRATVGLDAVTVGNLSGIKTVVRGDFVTKGASHGRATASIAAGGELSASIGQVRTGGAPQATSILAKIDLGGNGAAVGAQKSVTTRATTDGAMQLGGGAPKANVRGQIAVRATASDPKAASAAAAIGGTVNIGISQTK